MARVTRGDTAARIRAYQRHAAERQQGGRFAPGVLAHIVAYAVVLLLLAALAVQQLARRAEWTFADFARGGLTVVMLLVACYAFAAAWERR